MSLLTSLTAGNSDQYYYIENIGGNGRGGNAVPCIRGGDALGALRVSDADTGLVITGGGIGANPQIQGIRGGYPETSTLNGEVRLGASALSFQNIVLKDALTTVNTDMVTQGIDADNIFVTGNADFLSTINLVNGNANGQTIAGYYTRTVAITGGGAVANPSGLTTGLYSVQYVGNGAGNEQAQPSGLFYWSGTVWTGNAVSSAFTAGTPDAPNTAIHPVSGGATLNIGGASIPATGNVIFRKVMA